MRQHLSLALYCLVFISLYIGVLRSPSIALPSACCMFALDQWGQSVHPWLIAHQSVTNIAIGLIIVQAAVTRRIRSGKWNFQFYVEWGIAAALFGYSFISLAWTPRLDLALPLWIHQAPYILTLVFLTSLLIDNVFELRRGLRWLMLVGGGLVVGILLLGDWGGRGLMVGGTSSSAFETNPLALATFSGMVVCVAVFLAEKKSRPAMFVVQLLIALAGFILVIRTESRGQLGALIASLVLVSPMAFPLTKVKGLVTMGIAGTVLTATVIVGLQDYVTMGYGRWSEESIAENVTGRLQMAKALLVAWLDSPLAILFGLGNSASFDPRIVGFYPHIVPLEILGEEGLIGFCLYLFFCFMALKNFLAARRVSRLDESDGRLIAALGAMVLFTFVASLKQGNLLGNAFFFLTVLILARAVHVLRNRIEVGPLPATTKSRERPQNLMS